MNIIIGDYITLYQQLGGYKVFLSYNILHFPPTLVFSMSFNHHVLHFAKLIQWVNGINMLRETMSLIIYQHVIPSTGILLDFIIFSSVSSK